VPSTSNGATGRGTCQCQPGWGGVSCNECADDHWGSKCQGTPLICESDGRSYQHVSETVPNVMMVSPGLALAWELLPILPKVSC